MAFSEYTLKYAWKRAGGNYPPASSQCECTGISHDHNRNRCKKRLVWDKRGRTDIGAWEAYSFSDRYQDGPFDCAILCWNCHKAVSATASSKKAIPETSSSNTVNSLTALSSKVTAIQKLPDENAPGNPQG